MEKKLEEFMTYDSRSVINTEGRFIIGLYGCKCHPFSSWEECDKYHRQQFKVGDFVGHRHLVAQGTIFRTYSAMWRYFVDVKYGPLMSDVRQEHVCQLELIKKK